MPTGFRGCDRNSYLALTRGVMSRASRVMPALRRSGLQAAVVILLAATALPVQAQFRDVLVFAAASVKDALDEANSLFLFENGSGVRVSYGASSALAKQIENGAPADVFISADLDWMDYVAERTLIKPEAREEYLGDLLGLIGGAKRQIL